MFGKELNKSNNCYLSQVTMIESKCEKPDTSFRKKVNMPATVFSRSPLKDRENKSIVGNTPSRQTTTQSRVSMGPTEESSRRTSISPLKNRRQMTNIQQNTFNIDHDSSTFSQANYSSARVLPQPQLGSSISSQVGRSKKVQSCQNHSNKPAKYVISIDEEDLPYCQKCAILLASQGFKVSKCDEPAQPNVKSSNNLFAIPQSQPQTANLLDDHSHPRRNEISLFLAELQSVMSILTSRKEELESTNNKNEQQYQRQCSLVASFYQKIIDDVVSHRKAVESAMAQQHSQVRQAGNTVLEAINQAISDSRMMKEDILSSLDLIKDAEEKDYRPIMESYKDNARKFKQTSQRVGTKVEELSLCLVDCSALTKKFLHNISRTLAGDEPTPEHRQPSNHSSINFSFEARAREEEIERQRQTKEHPVRDIPIMGSKILPGPPSQDQNPVQLLSQQDLSRQKFMKSSLKDAKGLFTQFDDFVM